MIKENEFLSIQAKASLWYMICNIIQRGISFFVVPLYIRLLTTYQYGKYTVFQSWKELLIIIVTMNLYCGVYTKAMVDYPNKRYEYTSSMQGLTTVLAFFWFFIYLFGKKYWLQLFGVDETTMLLLFLFFVFSPSFTFWSVKQRVEYKYKNMVMVTLLESLLIPICSILVIKVTSLESKGLIWTYLIVETLFGIVFYIYHFIKGKTFFNKDYWEHALLFNIPLIPHYLSLIVLSQADRIMIEKMVGADKAAIYGFAYSIAMVMNMITSAINGSIVPWLYEKMKGNDFQNIKRVINPILLFLAIITSLIILISPELVMLLGTKEYFNAIYIIPAVSTSSFLIFCYGLYSNVEFYYGKTKYVMIASVVGAVINIVLNYFFIMKYGYVAAGYTTLISYIVLLLMHYFYYKKILVEKTGNSAIYDDSFIMISSVILIVGMLACLIVYRSLKMRYCAILIIVAIIILFRSKIINIIKELIK